MAPGGCVWLHVSEDVPPAQEAAAEIGGLSSLPAP